MLLLRIKEICKEKSISINELADKVGLTRVSISNMIAGRQSPPVSTLEKIADALDVEVWMLLKAPEETGSALHCPKCGAKLQITEVE